MWYNKKQIGGSNFLNLNIMNSKNKLTSFGSYKGISLIISVLILSLSISYLVFAWSEPIAVPPGDNVSPPLNISSVDQSKEGGLILNTGGASANGLVVENGNVGVGVVAPNAKLEIDMGTSATEGLHISRTAPGANSYFNIKDESNNSIFKVHENGNVGIGTANPEFKLSIDNDGGIIAKGTYGTGNTLSVSGAGTRLIWYPRKAAFRAGGVHGTEWDDVNVGNYSFAVGEEVIASGEDSIAMGYDAIATSDAAVAIGYSVTASNWGALAMGNRTIASGANSVALGTWTEASGDVSVAMGQNSVASGWNSTAIGWTTEASGSASTALGGLTLATADSATAMGAWTEANGISSTSMGEDTIANGTASTSMGDHTTANMDYSISAGRYVTANAINAITLGQGVTNTNRLINNSASSLMIGFNSDTPTFFVGPSAGMGTTGSVGIGTIAPGAKLEVVGDVMATTFLYSSDERLKENIIKIDNSLEKIMKLDGISFTWKENGEESIGIIAQNLEEVFPELVKTNEEAGMKSVEYGNLAAPIIEAIKEQQKMIEEQRELINNQQEQIDVLKIKLENIVQ